MGTWFLVGLYSSLMVYRLFFNPLNRVPGPYWARISKFHLCSRQRKERKLHWYLKEAHRKYGPFVRIGPNDISVTDPEAVQIISAARCIKSEMYGVDLPHQSLHTTRDPAIYAARRRVWSSAFSEKDIRGYENRVQVYIERFLAQIDGHYGIPTPNSPLSSLLSSLLSAFLDYTHPPLPPSQGTCSVSLRTLT